MPQGRSRRRYCVLLWLGVVLCAPVFSQEPAGEPDAPPPSSRPKLRLGLEAKGNYRQSTRNRFPVPFPFQPDQLPPGQTKAFEETVDAGSHFEVSNVSLFGDAAWGSWLTVHAKVDFIDLYDRNPTSTGQKVDIDEAWVRLGAEPLPATLSPRSGVYLKLGKFAKFDPVWSWPKPHQKPHPPIILGGESDHTLRRIVDYCDGWLPRIRQGFDAKQSIERLHKMAEKKGRDPKTLSVTVFGAPTKPEALADYAKAGIDSALLAIPDDSRDDILRYLDKIAPLARPYVKEAA